jgi:hypothetical protein
MFSRDETAPSVQTSTSSQHSRFRRWAARRARQLSIAALVVAGILVVGACGVMLRRATGLIGLSDIRYIAHHCLRGLESRISTWAANPKTDVSLLHRALNDVHENEPKPEWDAF